MIKILAIDDINDNLVILKAIINDVFPESIVYFAQNGPKGIELAIAHDPDVILLDILMPGMDGFEVCHRLKQDKKVQDIPVIFITALNADKSNRIKALEAGAEAFLSKPIDETELTAVIRAMLKIKTANMEKRDEKELLASLVHERTHQLEQELEERRRAEKALKESEERFQMLFNEAPLGYQSLDFDGNFIEVNKQWLDTLGYSRNEVIGKWFGDFLSPVYQDGFRKRFPIFKSQGHIHSEFEMVHKDGTKLFIAFEGKIGYDLKGDFKQTHCILQDITTSKKTEDALKESQLLLQSSIESLKDTIVLSINQQYQYLYFNTFHKNVMLDTYGKEVKLGMDLLECITNDDDRIKAKINYDRALKGESHTTTEEFGDLDRYYYETRYNPIVNDKNEVIGATAFSSNITERKHAEELLRKSEEKHRLLFEQASDGIFIADSQGNYLDVNSSGCAMLGYSREEILKFNIKDIITAENLSKNGIKYKELNSGGVIMSERELKCKNGTALPVEISGKILPDGRFQGMVRNITDRKWAEEKLRESERKFRNLFENMDDAFALHKIIIDENNNPIDYEFIDVNPVFCNRLGMKPEDIINHSALELFPKTEQSWIDAFGKVAITGESLQITNYSVELGRSYETRLYSPRPGYFAGLFSDVTEKIKVEEALRDSEETTRALLNGLPESTFLLDLQGNIIAANSTVAKRIGYSLEELKGHNIYEFVPPWIANRRKQAAEQVIQTGQPIYFEDEINGHFIDNRIHPIFDQDGHVQRLAVIGMDITERKLAEERLRESEEKFAKVFHDAPVLIAITDMNDATYLDVNDHALKVSGFSRDEVIGHTAEDINWINADDRAMLVRNILENGQVTDLEMTFHTKDGRILQGIVNGEQLILGDRSCLLTVTVDITDRKQAELALQEKNVLLIEAKERAEESDRLKSAFLANMSHEIRTPLNSIIGFSDLMLDPFFGPGQHTDFANIIKENGNNLLTIISNIMDLSKIEAGQVHVKKRLFFINQLITDIQKENSFRATEKGIELRLDSSNPKDEIFIKSDETRIKQILINLVSNAIKFTEKGVVEIGIKTTGEFVQFHVNDTGIGIPTKYHDQIFERFRQVETAFTRKYGGNGLGLPISKSLVELLGGKIWMESEEGKGSTFFFTVPNI